MNEQEYLTLADLPADNRAVAAKTMDARPKSAEKVNFDEALVADFDLDDPQQRKQAADVLFAVHKVKGDHAWNSALYREVGKFLASLRTRTNTHGFVKQRVRTTASERDLAQMLATGGVVTREQLALILRKEQMLVQNGIETLEQLAALLKETS